MKKILKFAAIALSTTLATSVLFACNNNNSSSSSSSSSALGTVSGSYQKTEAQPVAAKMTQLNYSALSGTDDQGAVKTGWSTGLTLENEGTFSFTGTGVSLSGFLSMDANVVGKEVAGQEVYNAAFNANAAMSCISEGVNTPASASLSAYYDGAYAYASVNAQLAGDSFNKKQKATIEDLLLWIDQIDWESFIPTEEPAPFAAEVVTPPVGETDITELVNTLSTLQSALGLEYSADFTNGTKLKAATTENTSILLAAMINSYIAQEYGAEAGIAVGFSKSKVEVYLCADAQNNLTEIAVNIDIAAALTMEGQTYNFTFQNALSLKVTGWQNVLPAGLATDPAYELFTPSQSPTPVE